MKKEILQAVWQIKAPAVLLCSYSAIRLAYKVPSGADDKSPETMLFVIVLAFILPDIIFGIGFFAFFFRLFFKIGQFVGYF